jgi:hypothetical protein
LFWEQRTRVRNTLHQVRHDLVVKRIRDWERLVESDPWLEASGYDSPFECLADIRAPGAAINQHGDVLWKVVQVADDFVEALENEFPFLNRGGTKEQDSEKADLPPAESWAGVPSTDIFASRLGEAFPGMRGVLEFHGETALDRLSAVLRDPLVQRNREPIWWFRAGSSCPIRRFERRSNGVLLNTTEFPVERIIVYRTHDGLYDFVYAEISGTPPSGLYPGIATEYDEELHRAPTEEFGVFQGHLLTLEELDDGFAEIDGSTVEVRSAERRTRILSRHNFVICGKSSPLNCTEFDRISGPLLRRVLVGEADIQELVDRSRDFPRHSMNPGSVW